MSAIAPGPATAPGAAPRGRGWGRVVLFLVALLAAAAVADLAWPVRTDIRVFDPDRMARLDTDMWRSYYEKKPLLLFLQLGQVLREQFHMPFLRSQVTAFRAARAAFVFKRGHDRAEYERALPELQRYFRDILAISTTRFDVPRAADLELEWWIVHRQRAEHAPGDLSRAVADAAGALYGVDAARLATYADERAVAMTIRDDRQAAGGVSEAEWESIHQHLRTSWRALRAAF